MRKVQVKIKMIAGINDFRPTRGSEHAAGWDLRAVIYEPMRITSNPVLVKCGFQIEIPEGYQAEIRSRSGLALKGIVVANSPGTIDSDYRGEVGVILMNHDPDHVYGINPGDRIAQMVIMPVPSVELVYVDELGDTTRGAGGFGSTGIK